jgi:hypothetical protein
MMAAGELVDGVLDAEHPARFHATHPTSAKTFRLTFIRRPLPARRDQAPPIDPCVPTSARPMRSNGTKSGVSGGSGSCPLGDPSPDTTTTSSITLSGMSVGRCLSKGVR